MFLGSLSTKTPITKWLYHAVLVSVFIFRLVKCHFFLIRNQQKRLHFQIVLLKLEVNIYTLG